MIKYWKHSVVLCGAWLCTMAIYAQPSGQVVDKVAAVIGDKIVLQSEVQTHYLEYVAQGAVTNNTRCQVLEDLMYQKLLLIEAEEDTTMSVSDAQVEQELDKRIQYYISQFGSTEKFEKFYGKTVDQFKEEYRPEVKDLLLAQQMRSKITDGITVSPEDVRNYFNAIPKDSIPDINAQVQIAEIVKMPAITDLEKLAARKECEKLRQRVLKGEAMGTLAILYSDDPGSAKNGGEYKNIKRGTFDPEFEKMAFDLKDGEVSKVFEFSYGYDFIQLVHRHGELVDLRHILIMPKVSPEDLQGAADGLDSIYNLIKNDSLSFEEAAARFSDDKDTKSNGGLILNPQTNLPGWDMSQLGQLDPTLPFTLDKMKPGDISRPQPYTSPKGKQGYRIIMLKARTKPHKANLKDDYQLIQNAALAKKQQKVVNNWINGKIKDGLYVHIDNTYCNCKFQNHWVNAP